MSLRELQQWVSDDWKQRSTVQPSTELQLLYVIEEFGEVAEAIRKSAGHKARKDMKTDLGSEFADLIISITTLANSYDIDLADEIEKFKDRLASRHAKGF